LPGAAAFWRFAARGVFTPDFLFMLFLKTARKSGPKLIFSRSR
jgi:hypothetical protein